MKSLNAFLAIAALAIGATQLSCSVNDYCLGCEVGDGGAGSGDANDANDANDITDSGMDAACVPTGVETCDGVDNDCNGLVDDGTLPGVGAACANQQGACAGGVQACTGGALKCDKPPSAEQCDGIDNNCDGTIDDGDPGGGGKCGTDMGECVAGTSHCDMATGTVKCFGFQDHTGATEACNGKDDDCDGLFDETIGSLGSCGPATDDGECTFGTLMCTGGAPVCMGAVFPKFEVCNDLDDDCDNQQDEIFIKATDPNNCGTCNTVCATPSKTCINSANAGANCTQMSDCTGGAGPQACVVNSQRRCATGTCGYACNVGFMDLDTTAANGCEYKCSPTGAEECDGVDNDCNGIVDDGLTTPVGLCRGGGECGITAPTATCSGATGWKCTYPGTTQFPETLCDGKDNDCDLNIDENQPNKGLACDDGRVGACRGTGTFTCDSAAPNGPAKCTITTAGQTTADPGETCDNKDNDCDGKTDEGSDTGTLIGQDWVDIGGGVEIMKYEASRLDASSSQQGTKTDAFVAQLAASPGGASESGTTATFTTAAAHGLTVGTKVRVSNVGVSGYNGLWTIASVPTTTSFTATLKTSGLAASGGGTITRFVGACSRTDAQPWTNVTYPEALAVCESMGASLCSETTWHQACSVVPPRTTPAAIDGGTTATSGTLIEAEDFFRNVYAGGPEVACGGTTDDDGDGRVNDGCPAFAGGAGPETGAQCTNNTDDDTDGRVNDGCPIQEEGGESGAQCTNNNDDDGDNRVNDGCPAVQEDGETGAQCNNNNDDDGDGNINDGCPATEQGTGPETACTGNTDDDGDGRANDGCASFEIGTGAETTCTGNTDNDADGRANDGCPAFEVGTGAETTCTGNTDDDNDNVVNDGCPTFELGTGAETVCGGTTGNDEDGDGVPNDGCPQVGGAPETGANCLDTADNDGDGADNDGCPAFAKGVGPETNCTNTTDDDGDGRVNDGCPVAVLGAGAETACTGNTDDDGDGRANDGCPAFALGAGAETACTGNTDDDGDGRANDGCPTYADGVGPETGTACNNTNDDDSDGRVNDGCPIVVSGVGPETGSQCTNNTDDDGDGRVNDGCGSVISGAGPETGAQCTNNNDDDGDNFVNDGCPEYIGGGEEGAQCDNNTDDDGDTLANDGCPSWGPQAWVEDYTAANPNLTQPQQNSGIADMKAVANIGTALSPANSLTQGPMLEYRVNIPTTAADWRLWVRVYSVNTAEDTVHFGFDASATPVAPTATLTNTVDSSWHWVQSSALSLTAGNQYLRLFMAEDGIKVDAIFIARGTTPQPPAALTTAGGTWSYATSPSTYQAMTCNGVDQSAANDNVLATGTLASCYADHTAGDVFDLSGNVKEWTLARVPGENPIRGGSSSDTAGGTSCGLNFALGTDTFFFPNVGFRCCR